jgi:hypothetical protein
MNKYNRFTFTLKNELRKKLYLDSSLLGFTSITDYLNELVERGLPASESVGKRLQTIEKKQDELSAILSEEINVLHKRLYLTYRIATYTLMRSFYIKAGEISESDADEVNSFIDNEIEKIKEMFKEN